MEQNNGYNSGAGVNNGLSVAGFTVSCCSLLLALMGITGVVGVVLSAVGRSQAVQNGDKTGLATAGIVVGIAGIINGIVGLMMF